MATATTLLATHNNHYRDEFVAKCLTFFVQGFDAIYNTTLSRCKKRRMLLRQFQEALESIPLWNSRIIATEHQRFLRDSNCMWLDDLIKGAFLETAANIARSQGMTVDVTLEIPNGVDFVHSCYINIAREAWKKPQLLYHDFDAVDKLRNRDEFERLVVRCLIDTFNKQLPLEKILANYLREQDHIDKSGDSAVPVSEEEYTYRTTDDQENEVEEIMPEEENDHADSCVGKDDDEKVVTGEQEDEGARQVERREIFTGKDALVKKMAETSVNNKRDGANNDDAEDADDRVTRIIKVGGAIDAVKQDEKAKGVEGAVVVPEETDQDAEEETASVLHAVLPSSTETPLVRWWEPTQSQMSEPPLEGQMRSSDEVDPIAPHSNEASVELEDGENNSRNEIEQGETPSREPPFVITHACASEEEDRFERANDDERESGGENEDQSADSPQVEGIVKTEMDIVGKEEVDGLVEREEVAFYEDGDVDTPDEDQEISVTIYPEEDDVVLAAVPSTNEVRGTRAPRRGSARRDATQEKITRILGPGITVTDFKDRKRRDRIKKYMLLNSYIHRH